MPLPLFLDRSPRPEECAATERVAPEGSGVGHTPVVGALSAVITRLVTSTITVTRILMYGVDVNDGVESQRKGPVLALQTPSRGYIDSILIPTWNPFETANEIIGPLQFYPDGETDSRSSPFWTYLVVPNFQKWPKMGRNH